MTIQETIAFLNNLLSKTNSKSEQKTYTCFINLLKAVKNKEELNSEQLQAIEEHLGSLELRATTSNQKKYIYKKLEAFKTYLKNNFSLIVEGHYTTLGMVFGMIFGSGLGLTIGTAIGAGIGTSIGLSMGTGLGMTLGIVIGAAKDAEAKKQGRQLKVK